MYACVNATFENSLLNELCLSFRHSKTGMARHFLQNGACLILNAGSKMTDIRFQFKTSFKL